MRATAAAASGVASRHCELLPLLAGWELLPRLVDLELCDVVLQSQVYAVS